MPAGTAIFPPARGGTRAEMLESTSGTEDAAHELVENLAQLPSRESTGLGERAAACTHEAAWGR